MKLKVLSNKKLFQITSWYHRQQNKCYPQRCLLAHFEASLDFSRTNLLARNNKFVTAVKFHYRVLQLTVWHLWGYHLLCWRWYTNLCREGQYWQWWSVAEIYCECNMVALFIFHRGETKSYLHCTVPLQSLFKQPISHKNQLVVLKNYKSVSKN